MLLLKGSKLTFDLLFDDGLLLRHLSVQGIKVENVAPASAEHGRVALANLGSELLHLLVVRNESQVVAAEAVDRGGAVGSGSASWGKWRPVDHFLGVEVLSLTLIGLDGDWVDNDLAHASDGLLFLLASFRASLVQVGAGVGLDSEASDVLLGVE